ncbi:MAG: hypothetical protein QOI75_6829 [Pseudonocardiales bacterium]|jgi:predicted small metal-binding protein|nr:hypothetical protein [Pseudonocardiales bacterium]
MGVWILMPEHDCDPPHIQGRSTQASGQRELIMQQQVKCECGYQAREDNEETLIKTVLGHVHDSHPELVDQVTPDVVRDWIELVP